MVKFSDNLSERQQRIVKAKIKGLKNKEIGELEYPEATPESQAVLISRELNKPNVAQYLSSSVQAVLTHENLSWQDVITPIKEALVAEKQNNFTGEITPDHTTRLNASKRLQDLLLTKPPTPEEPPDNGIPEHLQEALKAGDIKEVQRIIFNTGNEAVIDNGEA